MENDKELNKLIDDFIMGFLNEKENDLFRQRLEKDSGLAKQVMIRREMISGLEAFGRKTLRDDLKAIHSEVVSQKTGPAKRRSLLPYIAAVASVLVLVLAFAWLMNKNSILDSGALYTAYFEAPEISFSQRANTSDPQLLKLEQLYKDKNYEAALPLFESFLNKDATSDLLLAAGIAYLEEDQIEKALSSFQQITSKQDFNYTDEVNWYSGLAYLKAGDIPAAKRALQNLANDKNADHYKEAVDILKDLK